MPNDYLLLVEDDPISGNALSAILRRRGFEVRLSVTVADALAMLRQQAPSVLVLDLMLPDGDGMQVLHALRATGSTARVAVTTAVGDSDRLDTVRHMNPTILLQKPIDVTRLLKAIEF